MPDLLNYGDVMAPVYDDFFDEWFTERDVTDRVDFLHGLVGEGKALELGIGTGRLALPLAGRGVRVDGMDNSKAMLDHLRAKPGADDLNLYHDSFQKFSLDATYGLIYLVFNGLLLLNHQDEQISCLESIAAHLAPGGRAVIETSAPDPARWGQGDQAVRAESVSPNSLRLLASIHDPVKQVISSQQIKVDEAGGIRLYPERLRYIYHSEFALMVRIAGMSITKQFGTWRGDPFGRDSEVILSVLAKADPQSS